MSQTTFNRQLTLLVQGILKSYQIDNLQLEMDIVSAVRRLTEEKKDPAKMVEVRGDILSSLLQGARAENELTSMEARVKKVMGISIDGRSRFDEMLRFLIKKDKEGQTVEQYAEWCKEHPYDAPKFFKIADRPALLVETWNMAFIEPRKESRPEYEKVEHVEEVQAVPNPYKKPAILRGKVQ